MIKMPVTFVWPQCAFQHTLKIPMWPKLIRSPPLQRASYPGRSFGTLDPTLNSVGLSLAKLKDTKNLLNVSSTDEVNPLILRGRASCISQFVSEKWGYGLRVTN